MQREMQENEDEADAKKDEVTEAKAEADGANNPKADAEEDAAKATDEAGMYMRITHT